MSTAHLRLRMLCAMMAERSGGNKGRVAHEGENIYCVVVYAFTSMGLGPSSSINGKVSASSGLELLMSLQA